MVSETDPNKSTSSTESTEPSNGEPEPEQTSAEPEAEPEIFDRAYVEALREEAAGHRTRAQRADALAAALVTAIVEAEGTMQDPTDLPFSADLLDADGMVDRDKVRTAVSELLTAKPHLRSRRPVGSIPQGAESTDPTVSLADLLRSGAA